LVKTDVTFMTLVPEWTYLGTDACTLQVRRSGRILSRSLNLRLVTNEFLATARAEVTATTTDPPSGNNNEEQRYARKKSQL
jgi:hypothetical protein